MLLQAHYIFPKGNSSEQISEYISQVTTEDDVVIVMGAGDIITLSAALTDKVKKN